MRASEHNLDSLRGIVRKLQDENASLKRILDENGISYENDEIIDTVETQVWK